MSTGSPSDLELLAIAKTGNILALVEKAEKHEAQDTDAALTVHFFTMLTYGHLITGDYNAARFTLRRAEMEFKTQTAELNALRLVTRGLFNAQYKDAVAANASIKYECFPGMLHQAIIKRVLITFGKSYAESTVTDVATYLGVSAADVGAVAATVDEIKFDPSNGVIGVPDRAAGRAPLWGGDAMAKVTATSTFLQRPYDRDL